MGVSDGSLARDGTWRSVTAPARGRGPTDDAAHARHPVALDAPCLARTGARASASLVLGARGRCGSSPSAAKLPAPSRSRSRAERLRSPAPASWGSDARNRWRSTTRRASRVVWRRRPRAGLRRAWGVRSRTAPCGRTSSPPRLDPGSRPARRRRSPPQPCRGKDIESSAGRSTAVARDVLADHYRQLVGHAAPGRSHSSSSAVPLDGVADAWQRQASGESRPQDRRRAGGPGSGLQQTRHSARRCPRALGDALGSVRRTRGGCDDRVAVPPVERGAEVTRIHHWIGGTERRRAGRAAAGRCTTRRPACRPARWTSRRSRRSTARSPPRRTAFPAWRATLPLPPRRAVLPRSASSCTSTARTSRGSLTAEHGKVLSDAIGEVARGLEVIEYAAGSRRCSRAASPSRPRPGSTSTRSASRSASSPASRRSTSPRWCRCGCGRRRSPAGTPSC